MDFLAKIGRKIKRWLWGLLVLGLVIFGWLVAIKPLNQDEVIEVIVEAPEEKEEFLVGWITDIHNGKAEKKDKYPRLAKQALEATVNELKTLELDLLVVTGDIVDDKDMAAEEIEEKFIETRNALDQLEVKKYFVLGNHDVCFYPKDRAVFLLGMPERRYVFKIDNFNFIVLDEQFNSDETAYGEGNGCFARGYFPSKEKKWLTKQLEKAEGKVFILAHQPLNKKGEMRKHNLKNSGEVREILEESGKVDAVFAGHYDAPEEESEQEVNGIRYYILNSLVEKEGIVPYAIIKIAKETGEMELIRKTVEYEVSTD